MACDGDKKSSPLKSRFGSITKFDPVKDDRQVRTEHFLAACNDVISILNDLGNAFSFPKKDMLGNIKKIQDRFGSNSEKYSTLNKMLEEDALAKKKPSTTVVGIIWLLRGLDFLRAFLVNIAQDFKDKIIEENLRPSLIKAYDATLKQHHASMVQFVVCNTFRLAPYRATFMETLATDPSITTDVLISEIDEYMINFSATIDLIQSLLDEHKLNLS